MNNYTAICDQVKKLPSDIRLHLYSFIFFIDSKPLERLRYNRGYVERYNVLPLRSLLEVPNYIEMRRKEVSQECCNWPDSLEQAFHDGSYCMLRPLFEIY